ncbi:hypothetical protein ACQKKK_24885 [Peribacillus sp. NPDC006672]|uniref:hypothetical protein n=1 Tax=Peribacillus sp. NPDC006672 TaxID=3390606 RepID=UPI003D05EB2A
MFLFGAIIIYLCLAFFWTFLFSLFKKRLYVFIAPFSILVISLLLFGLGSATPLAVDSSTREPLHPLSQPSASYTLTSFAVIALAPPSFILAFVIFIIRGKKVK